MNRFTNPPQKHVIDDYNDWVVVKQMFEDDEDDVEHGINQWLCEFFGIVTYDDAISEKIGYQIRTVILNLADGKSFDYENSSETEYTNHLIILNYLASCDIISWGTSIRFPWLNDRFNYNEDTRFITSELVELLRSRDK